MPEGLAVPRRHTSRNLQCFKGTGCGMFHLQIAPRQHPSICYAILWAVGMGKGFDCLRCTGGSNLILIAIRSTEHNKRLLLKLLFGHMYGCWQGRSF